MNVLPAAWLTHGAPCVYTSPAGIVERGFYACTIADSWAVILVNYGICVERVKLARVSLDLDHPIGRDIAVRRLARLWGGEEGLTAPRFFLSDVEDAWLLDIGGIIVLFTDRRYSPLPDGISSRRRYVFNLPLNPLQGAEALRLCCLSMGPA